MRRRLPWILLSFTLPAAALFADPDEPKTVPDASPTDPEPPKGPGVRRESSILREALRKVEDLLRTREARLLEEVRKIVEEEMRRDAEARKRTQSERRARAGRAGTRLKEIERRLAALKEGLDEAIARARKALGEPPAEAEPAAEPEEETQAAPRPPVPEPYRKLVQAIRQHDMGEYEKAIEGLGEAIQGLEKMNTAEARRYRAEALYYSACAHAVLGRIAPAFAALEQAIRAGYQNLDKIENDAELDPLREDPRFERLHRYARSLKG